MSCKPLSRCAPDRQPAVPCPHRSVHPREPGDRNATIVAFVRDCRSEATTRAGGSRQRIMCPGRDRICGSSGWCTGRRFLAAAVSRVVAGAGAVTDQSGSISDDHTFWPSAYGYTTFAVNGAVADVTAPFCMNQ